MWNPKIYTLEELTQVPPTYKLFGGIRGALQTGINRQNRGKIFDYGYLMGIESGKEKQIPISEEQGKRIGIQEGYVRGVKDYMVEGENYLLIPSEGKPAIFNNFDKTLTENEIGKPINKMIADLKVGKTFEESKYNTDLQDIIDAIKIEHKYSDNLLKQFTVTDKKELGLKTTADEDYDFFLASGELADADEKIIQATKSQKKLYDDEYKFITSGNINRKYIDELGIQPSKTPYILTDEWNLYNTRKLSNDVAGKGKNFRTSGLSIISTDVKDFIFVPKQISEVEIIDNIHENEIKRGEQILNFMKVHNFDSEIFSIPDTTKLVLNISEQKNEEQKIEEHKTTKKVPKKPTKSTDKKRPDPKTAPPANVLTREQRERMRHVLEKQKKEHVQGIVHQNFPIYNPNQSEPKKTGSKKSGSKKPGSKK